LAYFLRLQKVREKKKPISVYLVLKRRRWRLKSDHQITIQSDYSFIAKGVKLTQEVADFLKGTGRDPRRYDK
jgi:hypothetical protein